jgi:hypothetical protein
MADDMFVYSVFKGVGFAVYDIGSRIRLCRDLESANDFIATEHSGYQEDPWNFNMWKERHPYALENLQKLYKGPEWGSFIAIMKTTVH